MTDRHTLELQGYNALLADHCELSDRVAAHDAALSALHARIDGMAAELRALGCHVTVNEEVVQDFGHGVKLIRRLALDPTPTAQISPTPPAPPAPVNTQESAP